MKLILRLVVALACYASSAVGIFFILIGAAEFTRYSRFGWLLPSLWCLAWLTHLLMAGAWVFDRRLPRAWPTVGVYLGALSFAAPALAVLADSLAEGFPLPLVSATSMAGMAIIELLLLAPSVLLAVRLVEYHWSPARQSSAVG